MENEMQETLFPVFKGPPLNIPVRFQGKIVVFTETGNGKFRIHETDPGRFGAHLNDNLGAFGYYFYFREASDSEISDFSINESDYTAKAHAHKQQNAIFREIIRRIHREGERPIKAVNPGGRIIRMTKFEWFVVQLQWIWHCENSWVGDNIRGGIVGYRIAYDQGLADALIASVSPR